MINERGMECVIEEERVWLVEFFARLRSHPTKHRVNIGNLE